MSRKQIHKKSSKDLNDDLDLSDDTPKSKMAHSQDFQKHKVPLKEFLKRPQSKKHHKQEISDLDDDYDNSDKQVQISPNSGKKSKQKLGNRSELKQDISQNPSIPQNNFEEPNWVFPIQYDQWRSAEKKILKRNQNFTIDVLFSLY